MSEFTFDDLRPAEIEAYLKSQNWTALRDVANGRVWILTPQGAKPAEEINVFVPHKTEFGDYRRRLQDVMETLSHAESRPVSEIIRNLIQTSADVVRFRLAHTFPDESVRLADALTLFQRARQTLRAAALSAVAPKPVHSSGAAPRQVDAYLAALRLGHSERGSYVVPVISPLGSVEAPPEELMMRSDEPFARFATAELSSGLGAIDSAVKSAREGDDLRSFATAVPLGVSSDLCDAISELARAGSGAGESGAASMTIHFSWSPLRPVRAELRSSFSVAREDIPILQDAARFLKASVPRPRIAITGQVVRLERQENEPDGSIGIRGDIGDGEERIVVVRLSPTDYAQALYAHDRRLPVTCAGALERRGTHLALAEPIEFNAPGSLF